MNKTPTTDIAPEDAPRWLVITLRILAYGIPLTFLAYVLYINYLPFGYEKTFTIDVGAEGDTDSSQVFYLEPSPDLSERKVAEDGSTYRELNGVAYAVFKPDVVLKDAEITVSVEGEGVSIIPPYIDFNPNDYEWDYEWDFTQGKTPEELGLVGYAYPFDGAMYFDGTSRLEFPDSADKFEDGPFTVYVEWFPSDAENNFQQIVGHYNWEILQNSNSVVFQIGNMIDVNGVQNRLSYEIDTDFFYNSHVAMGKYVPTSGTDNGYFEFFLDNILVGRISIGNEYIWKEYGQMNLSMGQSMHNSGKSPYFSGQINRVLFVYKAIDISNQVKSSFISKNNNDLFVIVTGVGQTKSIELYVAH